MSDLVIDDAAFGQTLEMVGGDLGFVGQLVDEYRADGANRVADMRTALAAGAAEDLRRAAHTLKGSSASLGATGLAAACREVETAAREGRLDGLGPRVDAIAAQFDDVVAALETRVRERRMSTEPTVGRILVVDDNPVDRALLVRFLAGEGYDAIEADSGGRALELLRQDAAVDLVLLDLLMPGLDGFETLATIKGDAALAALPVIVISGLDELDSVVRCIETGAADYLLRPFQPALLRARITASLGEKRLRETIERQRTELARFVSPQIAALVSSPEGEQLLAGHRRQVTALFADLRGFTKFSETAEPEELLGVLRAYHGAMGAIVVKHGGTLEHFAGDGMLVFFNDPVPQEDHAQRAVAMAIEMRARFADLASGWHKLGYELGLGIGISTGYATLGRIGFEGRYDYAAIGSVVILASRLSTEAKADQILLGQRTYAAVEGSFEVESAGELELKGFSRPMPAYLALG